MPQSDNLALQRKTYDNIPFDVNLLFYVEKKKFNTFNHDIKMDYQKCCLSVRYKTMHSQVYSLPISQKRKNLKEEKKRKARASEIQ